MRSFYIHVSIVFLLGTIACKQDATTTQEGSAQDVQNQTTESATQEDAKPTDRATTEGHDYSFITHELFHFKDAYGGPKDAEQPFKDQWIDLDPNGTFKAGKLKQETHTGKWSYNDNTKLLFLKPDVSTFPMSEWKVMHNEQMMVWLGTQTYGNNPLQVKLVRHKELP